ncbi:MAG: MFS transporter, partial [Saccharomonospora viridis]
RTADIQQSLNNSMLHLGIALGSFVGSTVIDRFGVMYNARVGALFVLLALGAALVSFRHPRTVTAKP